MKSFVIGPRVMGDCRPTFCGLISSPARRCRTTWWACCVERRSVKANGPPACAPKAGVLPLLLPRGKEYLDKKVQFVHVDDMARLLVYLLDRPRPIPR